MCARKLKYHHKYLLRLELYAKAIGIKLQWVENDDGSEFIPSRNKIKLSANLSDAEEIAIFLHELGHTLDDTLVYGSMQARLSNAYIAYYDNKATKSQSKRVMQCEKRAWHYGRFIAKRCGIRLGKWYDIVRNECLKSYRDGK